MNKRWSDEAWSDYVYWQSQDKKTEFLVSDGVFSPSETY